MTNWSGLAAVSMAALVMLPASALAQDATTSVDQARAAAGNNRHDEAIAAYRRAIELAPERRRDLLTDLADQLTWAQRPVEAIPLYREAAEGAAGNRDAERRARTGLARALSWAGQHDAAIAEYDRALALDPDNRELALARAEVLIWADRLKAADSAYTAILARYPDDRQAKRGKARVLSWRGKHRAAAHLAKQLLEAGEPDREAAVIAGESLDWMGRPDRAAALLAQHLAADPGNQKAAQLLSEIRRKALPEARADWRESRQSDRLEISQFSIDQRIPIQTGRGHVGLRYGHAAYRPDAGPVEKITVQRPGIYGGYRISDAVELNTAMGVDRIATRGAPGRHDRLVYDAYATYRPNDVLRVDLGASRWTFDSEPTLRAGLTASQLSLSADLRPDALHLVSIRASRTRYSDGNRRNWWQIEASRRLVDSPRVVAGYSYTAFDFSAPDQPGYYNPARQSTHEFKLRGAGQLTPNLRWDLRASAGYETEKPGGSRWAISANASLAQRIARNLEIEAGYDFSTSRTVASGGFERRTFRLTLRRRF